MSNIILVDDVITENSPDGKKIKGIVKTKEYSIMFMNKKNDIDALIASPPADLKLVLLDLDLSKIRADAEEILIALVKKNIKVIILSSLPKTAEKRMEKSLKSLPSMNTLYAKGALSYLYKSELDNNREIVANIIDRLIKDPINSQYYLIVDYKLANITIIDGNKNVIVEKNLSGVEPNWRVRTSPKSSYEVMLRCLFEMGKGHTTEVKLGNFYASSETIQKKSREVFSNQVKDIIEKEKPNNTATTSIISKLEKKSSKKTITAIDIIELKKDINEYLKSITTSSYSSFERALRSFMDSGFDFKHNILPGDFQKILGEFNDSIRERSNGLFVGRLLLSCGGHGDRSGNYRANVGKVRLLNHEEDTSHNLDWKKSIEQRLSFLEAEFKKLKKAS